MATDRSHDGRSTADSGTAPDGIDPWSEFLSESSEELQQLQSTGATVSSHASLQGAQSGSGVNIVPVSGAFDAAPFASETPSIELPPIEPASVVADAIGPEAGEQLSV